MLGGRRIHSCVVRKKPKVAFDKKFSFAKDLNLGDKGQLDCVVKVLDVNMYQDEYMNDVTEFVIEIRKAKPIEVKLVRQF